MGREWNREELMDVREALAGLYPFHTQRFDLVKRSGLDPLSINVEGSPRTAWFNIIEHAKHHIGGIEKILKAAREDFPLEEKLLLWGEELTNGNE